MSQIKMNRLGSNEIEVVMDGSVPLEMAERMAKSLRDKGMVEDKSCSSLTHRYFFIPENKAEDLADTLIKSLQKVAGVSTGQVQSNRKNVPGLAGWSMDPSTGTMHHSTSGMIFTKPHSEGGFGIFHGARQIGQVPDMGTAGKKIRHYIQNTMAPMDNGMYSPDQMGKGEDDPYWSPAGKRANQKRVREMEQGRASAPSARMPVVSGPKRSNPAAPNKTFHPEISGKMNKSNYGPQGAEQYSQADNIRRKLNNVGEQSGVGPNANTKQYASKIPAGTQTDPKLKRKQPVKKWTPEEIAEENKKRGLKKNEWGQHLEFPNADEMVERYQPGQYETNEDRYANDLANLMANKSLLGMQPPPQPTDQQMFGHLVANEEQIQKSEQEWGNSINNWLAEATKPISSRFASEEEELQYWSSIRVSDAPGSDSGF